MGTKRVEERLQVGVIGKIIRILTEGMSGEKAMVRLCLGEDRWL